jgi:hypothetical protein
MIRTTGFARFNKRVHWKNGAGTGVLKKKQQIPQGYPQTTRISG